MSNHVALASHWASRSHAKATNYRPSLTGDAVFRHGLLHLPCEGFLDGDGAGFFENALFLQEVVERGTYVFLLLRATHSDSFSQGIKNR